MYKRRQRAEREQALDHARRDLIDTRAELARAYRVFNDAADPDLIESTVLEICALQARYSRMLRDLKHISEV